jgi:hydrogenase maturation protease
LKVLSGGKVEAFPPSVLLMVSMNEHKFITVLGLGNILLKDEGFGVHFVKWFSERHRFGEAVQILDGGTLGYRLLDIITSTSHLIVVDVIKVDDEPGAIYRFTKEEMMLRMPEPTTAHEVEFPDVLFMAELAGESPEVTFLCIVPECYGTMELEMTPVMVEAFPKMEMLLLQELAGHGIKADEVR